MIKRFCIPAFTFVWILIIAGFAISSAEQEMNVTGAISAISQAGKSITIKDDKGRETIITGVDEKLLRELKIGNSVEAKYIVKDGKNVCKSIVEKGEKKKRPAPGY